MHIIICTRLLLADMNQHADLLMQALGLFLPSTCRTWLGLRPLDVIHSCRARRWRESCMQAVWL